MGYHRAGFDVIGVDLEPQPNYPFEFIQDDAIAWLKNELWLRGHGEPCWPIAAIHASPPCPRYCLVQAVNGDAAESHPDLVEPTRELLIETGLPYVIENVVGSPLHTPITLCGEMFGLGVIRHRLFESNWLLMQLAHIKHRGRVAGYRHGVKYDGPYLAVYGSGGDKGNVEQRQAALGIDWMTRPDELKNAIPPAYTEYIGEQLMAHVLSEVA